MSEFDSLPPIRTEGIDRGALARYFDFRRGFFQHAGFRVACDGHG